MTSAWVLFKIRYLVLMGLGIDGRGMSGRQMRRDPLMGCFSKSKKDPWWLHLKDATSSNPAEVLLWCLRSFEFYQGQSFIQTVFKDAVWVSCVFKAPTILCARTVPEPLFKEKEKVAQNLKAGPFQWLTPAHLLDCSIGCSRNARKASSLASEEPVLPPLWK